MNYKILGVALSLLMLLSASRACSVNINEMNPPKRAEINNLGETGEDTPELSENNDENSVQPPQNAQENTGEVIKTEMYDITILESWKDKIKIQEYSGQYNDYSLQFCHKASAEAGIDGHLFSICLFPDEDDYIELPDYRYLGRLLYSPNESYEVVATFPTDVQFSDETQSEYRELRDGIEDVIASFTPNAAYEFYPATNEND